jgi:hypothetical protein
MFPRIFAKILFALAGLFLLCISGHAQNKNLAQKSLSVSKKATVIIVGNSAKYAYKATKFTAGRVAKPVIVKSAPGVGKFVLKSSGLTLKKTFPLGKKLFIKYIKYKFLP